MRVDTSECGQVSVGGRGQVGAGWWVGGWLRRRRGGYWYILNSTGDGGTYGELSLVVHKDGLLGVNVLPPIIITSYIRYTCATVNRRGEG